MAGTEEPDRRRRLFLGLLVGLFISLAAVPATLFIVFLFRLGCAMGPTTSESWGCRAGSVYWPEVLISVVIAWIIGLVLVLVFLLQAPRSRFPTVGDSDDTDFWEWWRSESP